MIFVIAAFAFLYVFLLKENVKLERKKEFEKEADKIWPSKKSIKNKKS